MNGGAYAARITVLMVDDHPIVLSAITNIVSKSDDFEVYTAHSGAEALALYEQHKPDIVLCDINLDAHMSGIELTQRLVATYGARVVVFSSHTDHGTITSAIEAGAQGYITKGTPPPQLLELLREAARGREVYDSAVAVTVVSSKIRTSATDLDSDPLSPREEEILRLLCSEVINIREIADRLHISEATVKTHLNRLYFKLKVSSKTQAVARAFRYGIIKPEDLDSGI